mmetsp:Transcript_10618/g.25946  ORF Transcript_10618/g.25946 Transcript_10618/m.25946 type:complete len:241 (-) Transcript_10618:664-1386(-)
MLWKRVISFWWRCVERTADLGYRGSHRWMALSAARTMFPEPASTIITQSSAGPKLCTGLPEPISRASHRFSILSEPPVHTSTPLTTDNVDAESCRHTITGSRALLAFRSHNFTQSSAGEQLNRRDSSPAPTHFSSPQTFPACAFCSEKSSPIKMSPFCSPAYKTSPGATKQRTAGLTACFRESTSRPRMQTISPEPSAMHTSRVPGLRCTSQTGVGWVASFSLRSHSPFRNLRSRSCSAT